eukprot:131721_1
MPDYGVSHNTSYQSFPKYRYNPLRGNYQSNRNRLHAPIENTNNRTSSSTAYKRKCGKSKARLDLPDLSKARLPPQHIATAATPPRAKAEEDTVDNTIGWNFTAFGLLKSAWSNLIGTPSKKRNNPRNNRRQPMSQPPQSPLHEQPPNLVDDTTAIPVQQTRTNLSRIISQDTDNTNDHTKNHDTNGSTACAVISIHNLLQKTKLSPDDAVWLHSKIEQVTQGPTLRSGSVGLVQQISRPFENEDTETVTTNRTQHSIFSPYRYKYHKRCHKKRGMDEQMMESQKHPQRKRMRLSSRAKSSRNSISIQRKPFLDIYLRPITKIVPQYKEVEVEERKPSPQKDTSSKEPLSDTEAAMIGWQRQNMVANGSVDTALNRDDGGGRGGVKRSSVTLNGSGGGGGDGMGIVTVNRSDGACIVDDIGIVTNNDDDDTFIVKLIGDEGGEKNGLESLKHQESVSENVQMEVDRKEHKPLKKKRRNKVRSPLKDKKAENTTNCNKMNKDKDEDEEKDKNVHKKIMNESTPKDRNKHASDATPPNKFIPPSTPILDAVESADEMIKNTDSFEDIESHVAIEDKEAVDSKDNTTETDKETSNGTHIDTPTETITIDTDKKKEEDDDEQEANKEGKFSSGGYLARIMRRRKENYLAAYKKRLRRIYSTYQPNKLDKIDGFVEKYGFDVNKIHELYVMVCKKYNLVERDIYDGQNEDDYPAETTRIQMTIPLKQETSIIKAFKFTSTCTDQVSNQQCMMEEDMMEEDDEDEENSVNSGANTNNKAKNMNNSSWVTNNKSNANTSTKPTWFTAKFT